MKVTFVFEMRFACRLCSASNWFLQKTCLFLVVFVFIKYLIYIFKSDKSKKMNFLILLLIRIHGFYSMAEWDSVMSLTIQALMNMLSRNEGSKHIFNISQLKSKHWLFFQIYSFCVIFLSVFSVDDCFISLRSNKRMGNIGQGVFFSIGCE